MDNFTKRFYEKGNKVNKKEGMGSDKQYPIPNKKHELAKKMKKGIHKVGSNPSRFVHKGGKGDIDLYETWKGGKQHITRTK